MTTIDDLQRERYARPYLEALTASAETKAAYSGEFSFTREILDEEGNPETEKLDVPWSTIKEIMAAIRDRAAGSCEKTPT